MSDLDKLKATAEAATPGPWRATEPDEMSGCVVSDAPGEQWTPVPGPIAECDAEYIAAFDPPTVMDLIERVRRAEREVLRQYDGVEFGTLLGTFVQLAREIRGRHGR